MAQVLGQWHPIGTLRKFNGTLRNPMAQVLGQWHPIGTLRKFNGTLRNPLAQVFGQWHNGIPHHLPSPIESGIEPIV
jgi:hypothetical protein